MDSIPVAFIAAAIAMFVSQLIKIIIPVFKGEGRGFRNALKSGGMPSSHTAACTAMTLAVGLREGFGSSVFAVGAVLTAIVAHDAIKVRGTLNTVIRILKDSVPGENLESKSGLPDTVGHSTREVVAGFVLAIPAALGCHILLP